jgi:phosphoglycolate phosphatase-like HAD superfamily hydrolase
LIFDFDHTLAPLGHFVRWADAARELRDVYRTAGLLESFFREDDGCLGLYARVATSALVHPARLASIQRDASVVIARFEAEGVPQTHVFPVAITLADRMRELRLRAAVVSSNSSEVVRTILTRDKLIDVFETIVGREDVARLKPSPEGLLIACATMRLVPASCVYLGDTTYDIEAAVAAGMVPLGVATGLSNPDELIAAGAQAVIEDLGALTTPMD